MTPLSPLPCRSARGSAWRARNCPADKSGKRCRRALSLYGSTCLDLKNGTAHGQAAWSFQQQTVSKKELTASTQSQQVNISPSSSAIFPHHDDSFIGAVLRLLPLANGDKTLYAFFLILSRTHLDTPFTAQRDAIANFVVLRQSPSRSWEECWAL